MYLAEVGGSWADDAVALERVNREFCKPREWAGNVVVRAPITEATVRQWIQDDPEFAAALRIARQMRAEARALGLDKPQMVPPDRWPTAGGRLDQREDPCRIAYSVDDILNLRSGD
jgi:hypothetical protein